MAETDSAAVERRLRALEDEVDRLRAIEAVRRNVYIYTYLMDFALYDDVLDMVADDAESAEVGRRGVYVGKESMRTLWKDVLGRFYGGDRSRLHPGYLLYHHALSGVIDISEDRRTARTRFKYIGQTAEVGRGWVASQYGTYYLDWKRDDEDRWWLTKLFLPYLANSSTGDLVDGFNYGGGPDAEFPPDRPTTFHRPYPDVATPPWTFPHPTTGRPITAYDRAERYWHDVHSAQAGEVDEAGVERIREFLRDHSWHAAQPPGAGGRWQMDDPAARATDPTSPEHQTEKESK